METALPDFIRRQGLPDEPEKLTKALIRAQEVAALQSNETVILQTFLADTGWSPDLQEELFKIMRTEFRFALFDDTIPCLQRLNDAGCRVMVVSNDNRAPFIAIDLEIELRRRLRLCSSGCRGGRREVPVRGAANRVFALALDLPRDR